MAQIDYVNIEDGNDASANSVNQRFGQVIAEINGNIDTSNLKDFAVTREKIAPESITSDKLAFEQYVDDNGWSITDLGLVKLAAKRRTFKVPATAAGNGQFANFDAGMALNPVDFNPNGQYRVIHMPYMTGVSHAVGPWDLKMKEEDGIGFMKPSTKVVATRLNGGTSAANEPGAVETWVIF